MIQDIANKHGLALARAAGERSDLTPDRVAALLSRHAEHANVLEMLAHFGVITDFSMIDVDRSDLAQVIANTFNLAVAEHGRDKCIALTEAFNGESFVLCWTKLPVETKPEFVKAAVSKISQRKIQLEILVEALENIDD